MSDIIGTNGANSLDDAFSFGLPGFRNDRVAALGGNDTITITDGNDTVFGGTGHDRIVDAALAGFVSGDDQIFGEAGNDTIVAGAGRDTINGGADSDTVDYSRSEAAITVNLGSGAAQSGGLAAGDRLISIENVTASGFGDHLIGSGVANRLFGPWRQRPDLRPWRQRPDRWRQRQ
ncbi:calcium-binding protein [Rhodobacter capsulatus]|uniref:calcium-binding protein n=1 Tax=Rhodobacter capsulatus TaxID=1061 RepID=UPI0040297FB4